MVTRPKYAFALVGTGYMAQRHADALSAHDRIHLRAVVSSTRSAVAGGNLADRHGASYSTTDLDDALRDPLIDAVVIATPDPLHVAQVTAALKAGKHVLCEKALARSERDFEAIRHELSGQIVLQVGMNCRYREQFALPQQVIEGGSLGELRFARATYVVNSVAPTLAGEKPWAYADRHGTSPFLHGGGIHALDILIWVAGAPRSVFARGRADDLQAQFGLDTFVVSMEFASGAIGEFLVGASAFKPNDFSFEYWLSEGSIVGTQICRRTPDDIAGPPQNIEIIQARVDLMLQLDDFLSAVDGKSSPMNSLDQAFLNFRTIRAIEQSVAQRGEIALT